MNQETFMGCSINYGISNVQLTLIYIPLYVLQLNLCFRTPFPKEHETRRAGGAPAIVFFSESQHRGTHLNGRVEEHAATDALHNLL